MARRKRNRTASCAVAVEATTLLTAALRIAAAMAPTSARATGGSALSSPSNVTIFPYLLDFTRIYRLMPSVC